MSNDKVDSRLKTEEKVLLGHISGLFGVKGWVKVYSHTRPRSKIVEYKNWYLNDDFNQTISVEDGRPHKGGVVAKLKGIDDRDAAVAVIGHEIWVDGNDLTPLPDDEYYWYQLIGLQVLDTEKKLLGTVKDLLETGANDVLMVRGGGKAEHLIPYIYGQVIQSIDLTNKCMVVDWDPDF